MPSLVGDNSANPAGQVYICCQLTRQHKQAKAELYVSVVTSVPENSCFPCSACETDAESQLVVKVFDIARQSRSEPAACHCLLSGVLLAPWRKDVACLRLSTLPLEPLRSV